MKPIPALFVAVLVAVPTISFACQINAPLTRAQVREELIQLENAGYYPSASKVHYPDDIQAANARLAAKNKSAYGSSACDTSQAGQAGPRK
jgi:hypothetical protein